MSWLTVTGLGLFFLTALFGLDELEQCISEWRARRRDWRCVQAHARTRAVWGPGSEPPQLDTAAGEEPGSESEPGLGGGSATPASGRRPSIEGVR